MVSLIIFGILLSFFLIFIFISWRKNLTLIKSLKLAKDEISELKCKVEKTLKYLPEDAINIKKDLESSLNIKTENNGSFSEIKKNSYDLLKEIKKKSKLLEIFLNLCYKFRRELYLTLFTAPSITAVCLLGWEYLKVMGLIESSSDISQRRVFAIFVLCNCFLLASIWHAWSYFKNKKLVSNFKKKHDNLQNEYVIKTNKLKADFSHEEKELRGAIMLLDAEHDKRIEKAEKNSSLSDKQFLKKYRNS